MKRLVAKRKLKHGCDQCAKPISKGHVYYRKRTVVVDEGEIYGHTVTLCAQCKHRTDQQEFRFDDFKERCHHPEEFINEVWTYIPGEAVKEPSHCECMLCGSYL